DGLVLAPCDRSAIWLAKSLATLVFLAVAEAVALPVFALFFHHVRGATVAAFLLADVGICAVGTFVGAMAVVTRARDLLLPLLFLPLAIPILIGGVGASVVGAPGRYLAFLALYDAVFTILCWASFEYVVTELRPSRHNDGRGSHVPPPAAGARCGVARPRHDRARARLLRGPERR